MVVGLCGTARETVHDEVQSRLISQQRALQHNIEKLSRCVATNVKDANKLKDDRGVLEDDLGDKNKALGVDEGLMATVNSTMFVEAGGLTQALVPSDLSTLEGEGDPLCGGFG